MPGGISVSGTKGVAEGITNPPIDELLSKTDSKYGLVIYAAKRARQINAYYSQLGEGLLEYVGPLVETRVQEKPLSIALREIDAGLLTAEEVDPAELVSESPAAGASDVPASGVTAADFAAAAEPEQE
jgi:DNA-directed RNA polymerase subunit omega